MRDRNGKTNGHPDRREFLKGAALSAALGGAYLTGLGRVLAQSTRSAGPLSTELSGIRAARSFNMVVLGDSIMWGQGLKEEHKFTTLVRNWIAASLPGTQVTTHRYAHSGAVIEPDAEGDARSPTPGEVPNPYPSITAQLWTAAASVPASAPVDLVLINGGINDVKITTILTPDPSGTARLQRIPVITRELCTEGMKRLLPYVLQKFPIAKVLTTSYYPIVSPESDLTNLTTYLAVHGIPDAATPELRSRLSEQSQTFHQEYVNGVRTVALQAQPIQVAGTGVAATGIGPRRIGAGAASRQSIRLAPRRTAFAVISFEPENSYGAGRSWLWQEPETDLVAYSRKLQCDAVGQLNPACIGAAMGCPNIEGAKQYALAIQQQLEVFLPEWRQTFA